MKKNHIIVSEKYNQNIEEPPLYRKIETNQIQVKLKASDYSKCDCRPNDPSPCIAENDCHNVATKFECHKDLCPAQDKCQNQNFSRGQQYSFQVKKTESEGWGLFTKEDIPAEEFGRGDRQK